MPGIGPAVRKLIDALGSIDSSGSAPGADGVIATDDIDTWVDVEKFGITHPEATTKEER